MNNNINPTTKSTKQETGRQARVSPVATISSGDGR